MFKTLFTVYSTAKSGKEAIEDPEALATDLATGVVVVPLIIWSLFLIVLGGISALAGYVVWDYDFFKFTTWIFGLSLAGLWTLFFVIRGFIKRTVGAIKGRATTYAKNRFGGASKSKADYVDVKEV